MFIVTNREVDPTKKGLAQLGKQVNPLGPNELRIVEASKSRGKWGVEVLPDHCTPQMLRAAAIVPPVGEDGSLQPVFASRYVARKVFQAVRRDKRNVLFFVHGFNNDVEDVLNRADNLGKLYNLEVLAFSWPANGGGARGVTSYKADKRDARASVGALDRALDRVHGYLNEFNEALHAEIQTDALARYPDNSEERNRYLTEQIEKKCRFTVNMAAHSMGNYLFKNLLNSSVYRGDRLLFDNVVLIAADTNNEGHAEWVDRIQVRSRIFIALNENDAALAASRVKAGEEQKARLGHYPYNLNSRQAVYVDFTRVTKVGRSHAYFEGGPIANTRVRRFFREAFNGVPAEKPLRFEAATGLYKF